MWINTFCSSVENSVRRKFSHDCIHVKLRHSEYRDLTEAHGVLVLLKKKKKCILLNTQYSKTSKYKVHKFGRKMMLKT